MQNDPVEQSIQALFRALLPMCAVSLLVALLGYGIAKNIRPAYEVHFSYIIAMQSREPSSDFRYDGYYSLSGTELFSGTLASLITSPETIVQAYAASHMALPSQDPFALQKIVRAEKSAPLLVQVTVTSTAKDTAENLARGVDVATQHAVDAYNKGKGTVPFSITQTAPWTGRVQVAALPIALIAGVFSFFICCIIVLFREALTRTKE